jgi:GntR family transcriptional regulator, transcriptional repressor for pyruvate dehydrogenase complex
MNLPNDPSSSRSANLAQRVVDGVTERIRSGALKPGERVPTEPALMREFGVSRSVVREAVSWLQANGLLRTRHGVGSFVQLPQAASPLLATPPESVHLQQKLAMLELRLSLESDAAALAAQRRTPEQLMAMERALADFERSRATGEGTTEADFIFHEQLALATGNEYFVHVLRSLSGATIPRQPARASRRSANARTPRFGEPSPRLRDGKDITAQEHRAVLDAVRRGDPSAARAAMFMHLNNSRERMKGASN